MCDHNSATTTHLETIREGTSDENKTMHQMSYRKDN